MTSIETELCLGLPGGGGDITNESMKITGKRGFSETVDLKLNYLQSSNKSSSAAPDLCTAKWCNCTTRNFFFLPFLLPLQEFYQFRPQICTIRFRFVPLDFDFCVRLCSSVDLKEIKMKNPPMETCSKDPIKPPAKAQVVGWPPVRSFRKNIMAQKSNTEEGEKGSSSSSVAFVKVYMDGAPYLRKVDLKMFKTYQELADSLAKMFSSFTMGNYGPQGMINFMNESKLIDLLNSSEHVHTYEDKDGDWMLVGDVPWEMFVDSCKRLRIMKGSEAIGLAPRAMEKCKNRR